MRDGAFTYGAKCVDAQFLGCIIYPSTMLYLSFFIEKKKGFVPHNRAAILSGVSVEYNTAWQKVNTNLLLVSRKLHREAEL